MTSKSRIKISYLHESKQNNMLFPMNLHISAEQIIKLMQWATRNQIDLFITTVKIEEINID